MKVAKQAVSYYSAVTGNQWSDFYDKLDIALSEPLEAQTGENWLIHSLMNVIISHGISVNEFKINKDAVKAEFDEAGRKQNGEFFTPEVWCAEGRKFFDKYIPNWHSYNVWDGSCYSMDTEILTKRGWVLYDDLRDDDEIYTLNPDTHLGEWSGFHNRFKKHYVGNMVHFSGANIDLLVTEDHMMYCGHRLGHTFDAEYVSISAKDLYDIYTGKSPKYSPYSIKIAAEVCVNNKFIDCPFNDTEAFWQFIGFYLGDGGYYKDSSGYVNAIKFHCVKNRKIEYLKTLIDRLDIRYSEYDYRDKSDGELAIRVTDARLLEFIDKHIGFGTFEKHFDIGIVSPENYTHLLDGLLASDGRFRSKTKYDNESFEYYTANETLAGSVEVLANMCGYATYHGVRTRDNDSVEHKIYLKACRKAGVSSKNIELIASDCDVWDLTTNNDNHIFYVRRNSKPCFSKNCGSGNLMRSAGHPTDKLFLSSLQDTDIQTVLTTPEYAGVTAFQCDFLDGIDYDCYQTDFLNKLPTRLQEIIRNDEPFIIYMNPPYKTGMASATEVGKYMKECGLAKPAYDIFYQFCWRVMNFVELFNLHNCYYCFFGPLTFFTGAGANVLLKEFEKYFEFVDGMCISAQEFSDTSDSIIWGIGCSLWKSLGNEDPESHERKDILLEKKYLLPDGSVGSMGRVLYEPPRQKLSDWVKAEDIDFVKSAPLATSHLTFKGSEVFEKVAPKSGKIATNALGTLMVGNTLTRSADQSAILSVPSTISYESITEENFWRCVSSYAFRRVYDASWAVTKKEISAPNTNIEGYQEWLYNAIPLVLFEYKSMQASLRGVEWEGDKVDIRNHLFYLDADTVRQYCHDEVILKDLEEHPPCNQFMMKVIEEAKPHWAPEVRQLYDWCVNYTLATYDHRKDVGYKGSLECWDAGFQQIRSGCWDNSLNDELTKLLVIARDFIKKDVDKFGFVSDATSEDL